MSWSASYPPPPRRSRSRSPRGSYPPRSSFPDPNYPGGDSYRSDWDNYDRDRWSSYDRDRGPYEYGRRRSRSPPTDEATRKRRRSLSPYDRDRDRYDPRPRYNDDYDAHSRGYGYSSSPRRGPPGPYPPSRRAPPDPHTFDFPATLKQYAEWFRYFYPQQAIEEDNADKAAEQEAGNGTKPRNGIRSKWEKYKKEFAANQLQTMFEHHRKSPWFAEKYDPEYQYLRFRVRKEGWKGRINTLLDDLESGKFDPDCNETEPEPSSSAKETSPSAENAIETNGTTEENKPTGGDDEMQFTVEADEETVDPDINRVEANGKHLSDSKRNNRGEEISVAPEGNQVMIRTIPPDIGRVKLEEACSKIPGFMYLALGDPLQKRNFYRAGWIRFQDDADMTFAITELSEKKIEGFKLHVSHIIKPFTNRVRYTPEVASRPERLAKDLVNAKILASQLEEEAAKLRSMRLSALKPKTKSQSDNKKAEEEDALMATPQGVEEEEEDPEPRERGSDAVERRIEKVMAELRDQGLVDVDNEKEYEEKRTVVSLDLYLAYLRAAFHTCYYCAVITDHVEELQRKCIKHERKPLVPAPPAETKSTEAETIEKDKRTDEPEKEGADHEKDTRERQEGQKQEKRNDDRWLEWLDSKIALLINRDGVNPRDYGGKSSDEELSKGAEPHIKQEDEGKFRCKTCQKLFKAASFVEKHIANKHSELVKHLEELPYFNNFALDPHRIQPFTHPPPTVGNASQAPPPQAYGIQGPSYQEYGRVGGHYPYPPGSYPPLYNGYWDPYAYPYGPPAPYPPPPVPARRDEAGGRRLSERISGFATETTVPAGAGLPPKPPPAALDSALSSGSGRRNTRNNGGQVGGPPPPPPPDAKEDPRAAAGKRISYHDMDLVAEGDVELFY